MNIVSLGAQGNELVEFGDMINNNITAFQGDKNKIVLDKTTLSKTYPFTLTISTTDYGSDSVTLFAHFCQSLHMYKENKSKYEDWVEANPNYKDDERVIFVSTQSQEG